MPRAQCIVHRGDMVLMVKHRHAGREWWCLPGGGVEDGETPAQAALRELREECCVDGTALYETSVVTYVPGGRTYTYLIDIGSQEPRMGTDPEFSQAGQILADARWMSLSEIPARDRTFLWAAGLLGIETFFEKVESWGDAICYPGADLGGP